jgi:hypothetical protein
MVGPGSRRVSTDATTVAHERLDQQSPIGSKDSIMERKA